MKSVSYLLNKKGGLEGEPGLFYNYIVAGNGLFVEARGPLLEARVRIAEAEVRGLEPSWERIALPKGRIPGRLYDLALSVLCADRHHERYLAVTWEGEYRLRTPAQDMRTAGVEYEVLPNTVLDIHSHGEMRAFFSGTDDSDEQGLRLYMVVGRLDTLLPEVKMRVGVYGYFAQIDSKQVFA